MLPRMSKKGIRFANVSSVGSPKRVRPCCGGFLVLFSVLGCLLASRVAAQELTLVTTEGDRIAGTWLASEQEADHLTWQVESFVGPFHFPLDQIASIHADIDVDATEDRELCLCETAAGDRLQGMPVSLSDKLLTFSVIAEKRAQEVTIPVEHLLRLSSLRTPNKIVDAMLGSDASLRESAYGSWEAEGDSVRSKAGLAVASRELTTPPGCCTVGIEFEWEHGADFAIHLGEFVDPAKFKPEKVERQQRVVFPGGNDEKKKQETAGIRIETWQDRLVVLARDKESLDVLAVAERATGKTMANHIQVSLQIDPERQEIHVIRGGEFCGTLSLPESIATYWTTQPQAVRLEKFRGSFAFHGIRIATLHGQSKLPGQGERFCLYRDNGEVEFLESATWDNETKELLVVCAEVDAAAGDESADNSSDATKGGERSNKRAGDDSQAASKTDEVAKQLAESSQDDSESSRVTEKSKTGANASETKDEVNDQKGPTVVTAEEQSDGKPTDEDVEKDKEPSPTIERRALTDFTEICFGNVENESAATMRVTLTNGIQFAGEFHGCADGQLTLKSAIVKEALSFNVADLLTVSFSSKKDPSEEKLGMLRIGESSIRGQLVAGEATPLESCLWWKPVAARRAQQLKSNASGTIVYRSTAANSAKNKAKKAERIAKRPSNLLEHLLQAAGRALVNHQWNRKLKEQRPESAAFFKMELRSGDTIPFQLQRIDEEGITFVSPRTKQTFVAHSLVKAVTLTPECSPAVLTTLKRDRLLTIPRRYKDYPPTHLLLSFTGDVVRVRLKAVDEKFVTAEIGLEERRIPRDRVAAILWLDDGLGKADDQKENEAESKIDGMEVLAIQDSGNRLSMFPRSFKDGVIIGRNRVLGECEVDVASANRLAFGDEIQKMLKSFPANQIEMTAATLPKYLDEEGTPESRVTGQESSLVDKAAPPVKLKNLKGEPVSLDDFRGKVVVLDFWATWCGPCIQWLPKVEAIVAEFPADQVVLATVNLAEDAQAIQAILKRLEMEPIVLLDIDGVVTEAYEANAIPQTVIVDQQGMVQRVFVGGGAKFEEPLRDSIKSLLSSQEAADSAAGVPSK